MKNKKKLSLLTTAYFPPVQYFSKLFVSEEVYIEIYDNYQKQTYRNRCNILTANGIIPLTIPVHKLQTKTKTKDITIDYSTDWQKNHYKAIESAYGKSPFFEFLIDDFIVFFEKKYQFLIDLNLEIIETIFSILNISSKINYTSEFIAIDNDYDDLRFIIQPKSNVKDYNYKVKPYTQVFSDKFDFQPNLSILDLIFNMGSESLLYL